MAMSNKYIFVGILILLVTVGVLISAPYMLGGLHSGCESCRRAHSDLSKLAKKVSLFESDNRIDAEAQNYFSEKEDPWGNKYGYRFVNIDKYRCTLVWSFGADGVIGGSEDYDLDLFKVGSCKLVDKEIRGQIH